MGNNLTETMLGSFIPQNVAIGYQFTCVYSNIGVKCFGSNQYGKLGVGNTASVGENVNQLNDNLKFTVLGSNFIPKQVTLGSHHGCALSTINDIKCWGNGGSGKLGQGNTNNIGDNSGEMGDNINPLFKGCITDNPTNIPTKQTNVPTILTKTPSNTPTIPTISPTYYPTTTSSLITKITSGLAHNCALFENRDIKCWGRGAEAQLGSESVAPIGWNKNLCNLTAIDLGSDFIAKDIFTQENNNCALSIDNKVKCWGEDNGKGDAPNEMGDNLGYNDFGNNFTVKHMGLGTNHKCAVSTLNEVKCWGNNQYGKLGIGSTASSASLSSVNAIDLGTNFTADKVFLYESNTCVLSIEGTLKCFGAGNPGINANGNTNHIGDNPSEMGDNLPIINFGNDFIIKDVANGLGWHACVISTNNIVKCWGNCGGNLGKYVLL